MTDSPQLPMLSPASRLTVLQTLLWLALLQALRALFSALFGVTYDAVFAQTLGASYLVLVAAGLLLAFLAPLLSGRLGPRSTLAVAGLAMLARVLVSPDVPALRLWAGLLTTAAAFAALAAFLRQAARGTLTSLVVALLLDQLLRAAGSTWDLSLQPGWLPVQAGLALVGLGLAGSLRATKEWTDDSSLSLPGGMALAGLLFLQLNLLNLPNALARWSGSAELAEVGSAYAWLAPALWVAVRAGLWMGQVLSPSRERRALLTGLLVAGLLIGHLAGGGVSAAGLLLATTISVALLSALPRRAGGGGTGLGLAMGNLAFLILSFGLAFAFTYPYTLPALKGSGVAWYLAAALLSGLAILGEGMPASRPAGLALDWSWQRWRTAGLVGVILIAWLASRPAGLARPIDPQVQPGATPTLRLATYNIHYGYDGPWHLSLARQAETLAALQADVIALQEVDTGRITSYQIDDALWLGQRLGMYVVYLPTVEHLTGIALLSRYPVTEVGTTLLPSQPIGPLRGEEQTGLIHATLQVGEQRVDAFATWLGLSEAERARQVGAALAWVAGRSPRGPACLAGDLNSSPDSPTYRQLAEAGFGDPFRELGLGDVPTDPASAPDERIDYVWLRELTPLAAGVPDSLASDHRPVWVAVQAP